MKPLTLIFLIAAGMFMVVSSVANAAGDTGDSPDTEVLSFTEEGITGPVTLRKVAYIDKDIVSLGDIFLNVGSLASKSIAYAPVPGEMAVYGNRWLHRVSRYYELGWIPERANQEIQVIRESVIIDHDDIMFALQREMLNRGYSQDMQAELVSRNIQIFLPSSAQAEVAVETLRVDERTGRFTVVVAAPAGDLSAQRLQLSGRMYRTMEVPVTTRAISVGEVITSRDIEWRRLRESQVSNDTIVTELDLLGMTPRRSLRVGDVFRTSHIEAPVLIPRKSLVTVILKHPFMTLTVQGRSLEAGAKGDIIRIKNSASNTVLDAQVIGASLAVVHVPSQLASN